MNTVLGGLVAAYGVVALVGGVAAQLVVLADEPAAEVGLALDLASFFPFVVALCVFVLAESFRVGLRLRADVEGLV